MIKTGKIRFLAALVVVIAVATILATPDPTDDVTGILQSHRVVKSLKPISIWPIAAILQNLPSTQRSFIDFPADSTSQNVFRMSCSYRC